MFVIVSIGNGCSIRFCRCDHISITVITVSNRCSVISGYAGQLILVVICVGCCLSILSCLRCYIAKCIISVSFCSGCCRFGSKLILCIISLFTGCSIRIFNGCCAVLIIIMINGLISFVIRCCSRILSVLKSCCSFFCIGLLYDSSIERQYNGCGGTAAVRLEFDSAPVWRKWTKLGAYQPAPARVNSDQAAEFELAWSAATGKLTVKADGKCLAEYPAPEFSRFGKVLIHGQSGAQLADLVISGE